MKRKILVMTVLVLIILTDISSGAVYIAEEQLKEDIEIEYLIFADDNDLVCIKFIKTMQVKLVCFYGKVFISKEEREVFEESFKMIMAKVKPYQFLLDIKRFNREQEIQISLSDFNDPRQSYAIGFGSSFREAMEDLINNF